VRPLLIRPGAQYACAGDGLCCTDIHAIGPIKRKEREMLRLISPEVVVRKPEVDAHVLEMRADGSCLFLGERGCELHAAFGPFGKPGSCRRFPVGLTATPRGGRVTTEHRCPCRTMGERPPLKPEDVEEPLADAAGRIYADRRIEQLVPLAGGRRIEFERWEAMEDELLQGLLDGQDPAQLLGADPFPPLQSSSWVQVACELLDAEAESREENGTPSRFESALAWFGDAVLELVQGKEPDDERERPWSDAFDRAEQRSSEPREPGAVVADWLADDIWMMRWAVFGPFELKRLELATRYAVCQRLQRRLAGLGLRADRAAAEAVTIADLTGTADWWREVTRRIWGAHR
jgi:Fe-S-cluster containining protein